MRKGTGGGRGEPPLVGVRVEALDGPEAGAAIPTPDGVEPGKRGRWGVRGGGGGETGRGEPPLVGVRVEALDGPEAGAAVPNPDGVEPGKRERGGGVRGRGEREGERRGTGRGEEGVERMLRGAWGTVGGGMRGVGRERIVGGEGEGGEDRKRDRECER